MLGALKSRSQSEKRLIKLEKKGFELEAEKLRSEYNNKYMLNEIKMQSKSNKKLLTEIAPQKIGHFLQPTKIISVTAHKWVIYDFYSSKYIRGYRARDSHELSVFSKLIVFCAVNTIVQKYAIDSNRFQTIVTDGVLKLHKNSCRLKADDIISLEDLLHLMIIEENEVYETILAVNVGAFLERKRQKEYYSVYDNKDKYMKDHLKNFYQLVSSYCHLLKLENIRYVESDPDLRRESNKGSASDIGVISIECLKIPLFMSILKTLSHSIIVKYINFEGNLIHRTLMIENKSILTKFIPYNNVCRNWEEDNFMNSHCSIYYEHLTLRPIVVILLGSYGPSDREKDIQQITEWYLKNGKQELQSLQGLKSQNVQKVAQDSKERKSSSIRLTQLPIKASEYPMLQAKLKIVNGKEKSTKYDKAINSGAQARSIRIKTQL